MAACLIQGSIGTVIPRSQCREHPVVLWPDICDNSGQILVIIGQLFMKIYTTVIFRKYLALAQAQTSLTHILVPNISGQLFHKNPG